MREFETKVLDIDPKSITEKLISLGAVQKVELFLRRWVFIIQDREWIRLRDDGHQITLTYKRKIGSGISETEEIEVEVNNFEETALILSHLGFKESYYQENKRIPFVLNDTEFMIDTWPGLPPYLEVEANSEEKVLEGLHLLGLKGCDVGNLSVNDICARYGKNLHGCKELKFMGKFSKPL